MAKIKIKRKEELMEKENEIVSIDEILEINKSEKSDNFEEELKTKNPDAIEVDQLPSHFLPYDINTILIRRLKVKEVKLLSRLGLNPSFETIIKAHKKAILNYDIEELIPVDLKALILLIASITEPNFNIKISYNCSNEKCEHYTKPIVKALFFDDFEYEELDKPYYELQGEKFYPIRVKDLLFYEKNIEGKEVDIEDFDEDDMSLVLMTLANNPKIADENSMELFEETYNKIGEMDYTPEFEKVADKILPDMKPYVTKCPKCNTKLEIFIQLDFSRIYL